MEADIVLKPFAVWIHSSAASQSLTEVSNTQFYYMLFIVLCGAEMCILFQHCWEIQDRQQRMNLLMFSHNSYFHIIESRRWKAVTQSFKMVFLSFFFLSQENFQIFISLLNAAHCYMVGIFNTSAVSSKCTETSFKLCWGHRNNEEDPDTSVSLIKQTSNCPRHLQ